MSLQLLWSWCLSYPSQVVNGLALFLALAGGWLLLATRRREQRAASRLLLDGELSTLDEELGGDTQVERLNRFFYRFGGLSLLAALLLSSWSTTLQPAVSL